METQMMNHYHRTWAEIDLDAAAYNMRQIRAITKAKILAVVKADGYGHGCVNMAKTALENGAEYLGVACMDEARQLRHHGITAPILILGYTEPGDFAEVVRHDVTAAIYSYDNALALSRAALEQGKTAKIHLKIDTGMHRIGLMAERASSVVDAVKIANLPGLETEGIFSHFSCSDEPGNPYTEEQFKRFTAFCDELAVCGIRPKLRHICNSAATVLHPEMHLDMVRPGIVLYGAYPSDEVRREDFSLRPVMQVKARVTRVETVPQGSLVSYGGTYCAPEEVKLATVPIGYADGYTRMLSGKAYMIAGTETAPVVGRICMDQCMIRLAQGNNVKAEDEVVIMGSRDGMCVTAEQIAQQMGSISYELFCMIGKRVPRIYFKGGKVCDMVRFLV